MPDHPLSRTTSAAAVSGSARAHLRDRDDDDGTAGVREPRRPLPVKPRAGAAIPQSEDGSEPAPFDDCAAVGAATARPAG